ncbi:TPA: oligosaccharide flippase family protein [Vibrio alginolyticus]|nr:oligosaccharide flippase family protein [Vibrio alginolyticus]
MQSLKKGIKNFIYLMIAKGADMVVPVVVTPYLIRNIGIDGVGEIAFLLSVCAYFGVLIRFGFNISNSRDLSRSIDDNVSAISIINSTFVIQLSFSFFSFITVLALNELVFKQSLLLLSLALLLTIIQSLIPYWYFQAMENVKKIAIVTGLAKVTYMALILMFVSSSDDIENVFAFNIFSSLIVLVFSIFQIFNKYNLFDGFLNSLYIKDRVKKSRNEFLTQLAPSLYNNSSIFFLGVFSNTTVVGLYTAIQSILEIILTIARVMLSSFIGSLSRDKNVHSSFSKITFIILLLVVSFSFLMNELILNVYISELSSESIRIFNIGLMSVIFGSLFIIFNSGYLMLYGKSVLARNITVSISALGLILSLILTWKFEILGAIVSLLTSRMLLGLVSYYYYKKG